MSRPIAILMMVLACLPSSTMASDLASGKAAKNAAMRASRQQAALALIRFPWQQLHYDIVFLGPRRGFRAMTLAGKHRIEVYVRPQDSIQMIAYDIAHELGHVIDLTYNTGETRKNWMARRGIDPATSWFGCNQCSDYNTPAGDFAETFAMALRGPEFFRGRIAARPSNAELRALMPFFPIGSLHATLD